MSTKTAEVVARRALELAEEMRSRINDDTREYEAEIELLKHRLNDRPKVFCCVIGCPGHQHVSESCTREDTH